jgi:hypothetical protein
MTGEESRSAGKSCPWAEIKEKVLAAKPAGVREVILPAENEPNVREDLQGRAAEGPEAPLREVSRQGWWSSPWRRIPYKTKSIKAA